jgi:hypothetical protein
MASASISSPRSTALKIQPEEETMPIAEVPYLF